MLFCCADLMFQNPGIWWDNWIETVIDCANEDR